MREFLKGLDFDKETIDTIMAEHGKLITEAKEKSQELEKKNKELETTISQLNTDNKSKEEIQKELETLKTQIAEENAQKEQKIKDETFMNNINEVIGDKKFVNEFTKNAIVNELKTALKDETNVNKTTKEIFEAMTKDKNDIFVNPNKPADMPSGNDGEDINNVQQIPTLW